MVSPVSFAPCANAALAPGCLNPGVSFPQEGRNTAALKPGKSWLGLQRECQGAYRHHTVTTQAAFPSNFLGLEDTIAIYTSREPSSPFKKKKILAVPPHCSPWASTS